MLVAGDGGGGGTRCCGSADDKPPNGRVGVGYMYADGGAGGTVNDVATGGIETCDCCCGQGEGWCCVRGGWPGGCDAGQGAPGCRNGYDAADTAAGLY
jgi:hypothetical protein